ncbi:hypothetical protein Tco_0024758 [Tanacetum coccineum]
MEVDIEEDENEPELTYPYEEVDPLNPPPPASMSEPEDVIRAEDMVESKDETVLASVHEVGKSSTAPFLQEDSDGLMPGLMRRDINSLFDLSNEVLSSVEEGAAAMEKMVRKLGNAEEKVECKKLKKELEEARLNNTFLCMQYERRDFVVEERPNEAIDVLVEDEKSPSSEMRGSPHDAYVNATIVAERPRHANAENDARGSGPVRGQDTAPVVHECTFARFMKCNPTIFHGTERVVELQRWFKKTKSVFGISKCAEGKKVKFAAATLQGHVLT